jgi:hypothetical protein
MGQKSCCHLQLTLFFLLIQSIDVFIFLVRNEVTTTPLALLVMGESLYRKDLTLKNQFHEHELVTKGGPGGTLYMKLILL